MAYDPKRRAAGLFGGGDLFPVISAEVSRSLAEDGTFLTGGDTGHAKEGKFALDMLKAANNIPHIYPEVEILRPESIDVTEAMIRDAKLQPNPRINILFGAVPAAFPANAETLRAVVDEIHARLLPKTITVALRMEDRTMGTSTLLGDLIDLLHAAKIHGYRDGMEESRGVQQVNGEPIAFSGPFTFNTGQKKSSFNGNVAHAFVNLKLLASQGFTTYTPEETRELYGIPPRAPAPPNVSTAAATNLETLAQQRAAFERMAAAAADRTS